MKNVARIRLKALAATNKVETKHRARTAPTAPRVPRPAPLQRGRENQNLYNQAPGIFNQVSDDPYAFHPSEYTNKEELTFDDVFESPSEEDNVENVVQEDEVEDAGDDLLVEEDFDEEEEVGEDDSASDWELSSDSYDDESEESDKHVPSPAAKRKVVTMMRKKTSSAATTGTATATKKNSLVSSPDSSFVLYLSDIRANNTAAAAAKIPSSSVLQNQQQQTTSVAVAAHPTVPPAAAPANKTKRKKKLTFADQAALPVMIPKNVARQPAGTAILIELPPGAELAGASGVVGRILSGGGGGIGGGGNSASDSDTRDAPNSGIVLDLMGIQYATEVVQLPTSLAVAHLTGDTLLVDSILTTAVRAAAVPGQHLEANESVYSMDFDSDQSEYEENGAGAATTRTISKKKGGAGAAKARKKPARKAAGGAKKPRKSTVTTATKKRGHTSLKSKVGATRKK